MKGRLVGLAVVLALVVVVAGAVSIVLLGENAHRCEEAVSEIEAEALEGSPRFHQPDAFPDNVRDVMAEGTRSARSQDFQVARAEALVEPVNGLPAASLVATEVDEWDLSPGENTVLASSGSTLAMHDEDGELLWARDRGGVPSSRDAVGEDYLVVQTADEQPLSVVALDPESGEVRTCTQVGTAEAGEAADTEPVVATQLDDGTMALVQPGDDDHPSTIYRVDPHSTDEGDTGTVEWSRPIEETVRASAIGTSGDVIVFGGVKAETAERWQLVMRPAEGELEHLNEAGALAVHAVEAATGEPMWSFPAEPVIDGDGTPVPHVLVGATGGAVVVAADRLEEGENPEAQDDDRVVTTLSGLSPQTGEELWSTDLSFGGRGKLSTVELFGDVVAGIEDSAGHPSEMVALDAVTGEELWRHTPENVGGVGIDNGTLLGERLFFPGLKFQGIRVVDIRSGETEIVLAGLMVTEARSTEDGQLAVRVVLGGDEVVALYQLE